MKSLIEVRHLTKSYDDKVAVDDISFTVAKGEVFGLLGHNGAGKSTTIECLLGLKKKEKGEVKILDLNPEKQRKQLFERVGVQLQSSSYQDNIKVKELCEEMSSLYKAPEDYHLLLDQFNLKEFTDKRVDSLSGGEKQKLSILLALLSKPDIVFLDELTTGLDTLARRKVWSALLKLKKQGVTIFLTSHYMDEVERLCDRILILKDGKQLVQGTVAEVLRKSPYDSMEETYLWYMGEEEAI